MAKYADITGWGKCLPPAVLSNDDLATKLLDAAPLSVGVTPVPGAALSLLMSHEGLS